MSRRSDDRTRVLILTKGLGIGGAETLIADAASLWDRSTFDYRVAFLLPWKDQLQARIEAEGIAVDNLRWEGPQSLGAIRRLKRLCAEFEPDIIHSHLPVAGVLARTSCRKPIHVYTEHNVVDHYREPTKTLNRLTYGRSAAVIAVSEAVAQGISTYPGPEPVVVPNGIDVSVEAAEVAAIRGELGIETDRPLVVHVGNIRPLKGHANLIDAAHILSKSHPDVLIVSVGGEKHEGDLERLRTETRDRELEGHIRFTGRRADARAFLAASDCVVNPSDVEGLPVVLLEALSLGRPVVATDVGGVATVIKHETTGLLVPAGDPQALAAGVVRCLESPRARTWAEEGRRLANDEYGLGHMVRRYEHIYKELVGG